MEGFKEEILASSHKRVTIFAIKTENFHSRLVQTSQQRVRFAATFVWFREIITA